jgi:ribosomal protein L17
LENKTKEERDMQTSMSCVKINTIMNTQLVYPEVIREHLERLYAVAKSNYVYKNRKKFNFMKFGYDSEKVLKQQFESIFKDYRELHKDVDSLKHLQEQGTERSGHNEVCQATRWNQL